MSHDIQFVPMPFIRATKRNGVVMTPEEVNEFTSNLITWVADPRVTYTRFGRMFLSDDNAPNDLTLRWLMLRACVACPMASDTEFIYKAISRLIHGDIHLHQLCHRQYILLWDIPHTNLYTILRHHVRDFGITSEHVAHYAPYVPGPGIMPLVRGKAPLPAELTAMRLAREAAQDASDVRAAEAEGEVRGLSQERIALLVSLNRDVRATQRATRARQTEERTARYAQEEEAEKAAREARLEAAWAALEAAREDEDTQDRKRARK